MSQNCPFNTHSPSTNPNLKIPSVPVDTTVDIPFVPRPYSGVDYQMGGTTPPSESVNNVNNVPDGNFYQHNIYQVNPPHAQNTLTPCSVIGFKPSDPNSGPQRVSDPPGPRKCYNIYSSGQNMVGRICTTPGTEGSLYSREPQDGDGINGNADWVRGNQFGVRYNDSMINDRTKYIQNVPVLKEARKTYTSYDQFYPVPNRCIQNNKWYKEYPSSGNSDKYTSSGFPNWRYPYATTMENSRNPVKVLRTLDNSENIFENFSGGNINNSYTNSIFWIGIILILVSLMYRGKLFKYMNKK